MVKIKVGDIFSSEAQTIVNTVNCVGVMGKGVALEFKNRFPDMYRDYTRRCSLGQVKLGEPYLYRRLLTPWILNFPTKDHWRSVSRLSDIVRGLEYLTEHYKDWGITSLAVPPLGCGQGQLEWRVVGRTLYRHLNRLDIPVELYAPYGTPQAELDPNFLSLDSERKPSVPPSRIPPAWVALVTVLDKIEKEPYHWPIGRTTFQKIAYFATELGLPTGLRFARGSYGPFSDELKGLMTRLVNHGLIREEKLGNMFSVKPGATYKDAAKSFSDELKEWAGLVDQVVDLCLRMRTHEAEVAATVHFAAKSLLGTKKEPSETDVLEEVQKWKQKRRPPFDDKEVGLTIRNLNVLGWIDVTSSPRLPVPDEALHDF